MSRRTRRGRRYQWLAPLAFLLLALAAPNCAEAVDPYTMQITFSGYTRAETLTNFPVLLVFGNNINGSSFSYGQMASTNGWDLRFAANSNETTLLNYEIERWNISGSSYVWVQVPALTNSSSIWAFWGNAANGSAAALYTTNGSTWSNGFALVQHMNQTSGTTVKDSSTNLSTGAAIQGSGTWTNNGVADGCLQLSTNGYHNGIYMSGVAFSATWTMSLWFTNQVGGDLFTSFESDPYDIGMHSGTVQCYVQNGHWYDSGVAVPSVNQWQQITAVGAGGVTYIYLNGVYGGSCSGAYGSMQLSAIRSIGLWTDNAGYNFAAQFAQYLDEARIENTARSSNWIWAVWLNIASNSVFNGYSSVTGSNGVSISDFPFIETFETNTCVVGDLNGQHNWQVSAASKAMVETSVVYAGSQAASLLNATMSQTFTNSGDTFATNMWVQLYCRAPRRTTTGVPTLSNNTAAAFYIDTNGYVVAYGNNSWVTNTSFIAPTNDWVCLMASLDYQARTWSLYAVSNTGNGVATMLTTNLAFQSTAGNSSLGCFRLGAQNSQTIGYVDNISIESNTNTPTAIPSTWQLWQLAYLGSVTNSTNGPSAAAGWTLYQQFVAGTDPLNAASYLKILSCDVAASNSNDIVVRIFGGADTITNSYGSANFTRTFTIFAANNSSANTKVPVGSVADNLSGTNTWTDTGAASSYSSRLYNIAVTYAGVTITNTAEEWAMYSQNRSASQSYLVCVPVDYGSTNLANLNSTLGQQLGRGLYAFSASATSSADYIDYIDANGNWQQYFWITNSAGSNLWWNGAPANVPVTPGMAMWVVRGANTSTIRTNAVFSGRSFQPQTVTNFAFKTNYTGWTMFGWPLSSNKWNYGGTTSASNQLGFENVGLGGTTYNQYQTNKVGDQIWVWKNGTWKFYWLMDNRLPSGSNWNHKWWDQNSGKFANFALEPGMGYYYWHATNYTDAGNSISITATNFYWGPP